MVHVIHKGFVERCSTKWLKISFGKCPSTVLPHFCSGAEALFAILEHEDADIICLQEVSWTTRREAIQKLKTEEVVKSW